MKTFFKIIVWLVIYLIPATFVFKLAAHEVRNSTNTISILQFIFASLLILVYANQSNKWIDSIFNK